MPDKPQHRIVIARIDQRFRVAFEWRPNDDSEWQPAKIMFCPPFRLLEIIVEMTDALPD